jgi:UDP-N-acetylmuramoyl-tripeptide--D-alanyl-D-alanine ligase
MTRQTSRPAVSWSENASEQVASALDIGRGLAGVRPIAGRCVWKQAGDVTILDDTYNANPVSVRAALETIAAHRRGRP